MNKYIVAKQIKVDLDIQIYLLNVAENKKCIEYSIVPQAQLEKINKYKIKSDRDKRLLTRSFLYEFVKEHYNAPDFKLDFNEYQKPFLKGVPDIQFSFSYARDYVLIGISKGRKVGVDIEYIDPMLKMNEISAEIMCKPELIQFILYESNLLAQRVYFFKLFSAKEAIVKSFGTGLYFDVKKLCILYSNQFIYNNSKFSYQELGLWEGRYSMAISFEQ